MLKAETVAEKTIDQMRDELGTVADWCPYSYDTYSKQGREMAAVITRLVRTSRLEGALWAAQFLSCNGSATAGMRVREAAQASYDRSSKKS